MLKDGMKIIKVKDYQAMSDVASDIFIDLITKNPKAILGLATGSTPVGLYKNLIAAVKNKSISFKGIVTFNLDEYVGIPRSHSQSYFTFMNEQLFNHIDINKENTHVPNSENEPEKECQEYHDMLMKNRVDLQVLGIGSNGHIAFNEPGTSFDSVTQIVKLTENTRNDNKRFFASLEEVPTHSITMGIKDIMNAKKIVLLASGKNKAKAIFDTIKGPVTEKVPASILQKHKDVVIIIDEEAASLL